MRMTLLGLLLVPAACGPAAPPALTNNAAEPAATANAAAPPPAANAAAPAPTVDAAPPAQELNVAELETYPDARGMPADVQRFIVQWQGCSHWLGEPDWNAERRRQIAEAVAETCPGLDAEGRRLRARYAANPEVLERLRDYEPLNQ
jgi:hypothetical protein